MENLFVHWVKLPSGLKTEIITHMDLGMIRRLRATSNIEKALIDSMRISFEEVHVHFNGDQSYMSYRTTSGERIHIETESLSLTLQLIKKELAKMNFVYILVLTNDIPAEQFIPEKMRVRELRMSGSNNDDNHRAAIEQLDVDFLEAIEYSLREGHNDSQVFSLPQITETNDLVIHRNTITDEQLLRFNAPVMIIGPQTLITPGGLNALFKKTLGRLGSTHIHYYFNYPEGLQQYKAIIEGMRVKSEEHSEDEKEFRIVSPCDCYVLCLSFGKTHLEAYREEVIEHFVDIQPEPRRSRLTVWERIRNVIRRFINRIF